MSSGAYRKSKVSLICVTISTWFCKACCMPDLAPSTMTGMNDSRAAASERRLECRERAADKPRRSPIIPAASRRCISAAASALTSLPVHKNGKVSKY